MSSRRKKDDKVSRGRSSCCVDVKNDEVSLRRSSIQVRGEDDDVRQGSSSRRVDGADEKVCLVNKRRCVFQRRDVSSVLPAP